MSGAEKSNGSLEAWIDRFLDAEPLPTLDFEDADVLPPLTEKALSEGLDRLTRWQSSTAFYNETMALCASFRSRPSEFFNRPSLQSLRDAYILAEFARLQQPNTVRLADQKDQWPDGFVEIEGQVHNVEVTSTHGGRKLGKEYRSNQTTEDVRVDWAARAEAIPTWLDDAIHKKLQKKYGPRCILALYLNINDLDATQAETERVIAATKARYSQDFTAISVIWKRKLY